MSDRKRVIELPSAEYDPMRRSGIELPVSWRSTPLGTRDKGAPLWTVVIVFLLLAGPAWSPGTSAQDIAVTPAADSGEFEIRIGNSRVGTEKFEIRPTSSGWMASGELQLQGSDGKRISEISSLSLNATLLPTHYERIQKSPLSARLVAQFGPSETVLEMTATEGEPFQQIFYLPKNELAVLDTNFFHHFALLLRLYDHAKGAAQALNVFIPQEALPGTINLQYLSRESVPVGQTAIELDHFQAVTDELEIEIWATPEGAIHRISIPQANLEVVRK